MAGRTQPEQQAPPVQRLRVRYAKRGRARFTSHRDFSRAFERALRRAGVPMAYSSGFSPHPRISYANASPTGAATEAEYLEIGLSEVCDAAAVQRALDAALPPGLDIVEVVPAPPGAMADALTGSRWTVDLVGVPRDPLAAAVAALLASPQAPVQRMTKNGLRTFDARTALVALEVLAPGSGPAADGHGERQVLAMTLAHTVPAVRPDDVLSALVALDAAVAPSVPPVLTRWSQGLLDPVTGLVSEP